jgi:DNA polymerase-4
MVRDEAKSYGIQTAMGGAQARRLCPQAIVVPPRMAAYAEASRALYALFEDSTPSVEGLSIDEAFLEVRGMQRIAGTPWEIAVRLRRAAREHLGLPLTVGIARTKHLAKIASAAAKPDGLLLVPRGARCWRFRSSGSGVGPATLPGFAATASPPSAACPRARARSRGNAGHRFGATCALANNHDPRPVRRRPVGARSAPNATSAEHASHRRRPTSSRSSTASPADSARPDASAARSSSVSADGFTRATRSHHPHPAARTRATSRRPSPADRATIDQRRGSLIGIAIANLESDLLPALPFDCDSGGSSEGPSTRSALATVNRRHHGILRAQARLDMPLLPD